MSAIGVLQDVADGSGPRGPVDISSRDSGTGASDADCATLCEVLLHGADVHRALAAHALGRIRNPSAAETLIEALLDEDEDVRVEAAGALARIGDPRANRQLLENLVGDPSAQVKLYAIDALARTRAPELAGWLRRLLAGRDEEVAWDEEEFSQSGWDDWVDVQLKALAALGDLGVREAIPDIAKAIRDEDNQDLSDVGFAALAKLGPEGITALAGFLEDQDPRRRRRAATSLAASPDESARKAAARALDDPSPGVRLAAAVGLATQTPESPQLAGAFGDADPEVRAAVLKLAGRHHGAAVIGSLDDASGSVRKAALEVLADAPDLADAGGIVERVRGLVTDGDDDVAGAAIGALTVLAGADAVGELLLVLGDEERPERLRLAALRGLASMEGTNHVEAMALVLGGSSRLLRLEVMAALARFATADPWPNQAGDMLLGALRGDLIEAPEDEAPAETKEPAVDPDPRDDAANPNAEPQVVRSTLDAILGADTPEGRVFRERSESVGLTPTDLDYLAIARRRKLRKRVMPVVVKVAPHRDVRSLAARMLGEVARPEVVSALLQVLDDDDTELVAVVAESLARIAPAAGGLGEPETSALLARLADPDRSLRLAVLRSLASATCRVSLDVLAKHLRDDDSFVRAEAARSLGRRVASVPGLRRRLIDEEPRVRLAAARALCRIEGEGVLDELVRFALGHNGHHRREAARLLTRINAPAASARFQSVLADPDQGPRWSAAIEALEELSIAADDVAG